jgi:C4-dicarboxylate-specific signal transduction histidine kinase
LREGERIINLERTLADQNRVLREAQSALTQRNRLARVGQIAADMAVELNQRLGEISESLTELAGSALGQGSASTDLLARLAASIKDLQRLQELIRRLGEADGERGDASC